MNNPEISVCIPVYNGELFIEEAIDSVLSQGFTNFELIIIDNNSTDKTVDRVKKYNDPRIRLLLNEKNIGLIPNWNKAIENSKGRYIKILPADDFIYPGCLEKQVEILNNDTAEKISIVCGSRNIINDKGKVLFTRGFSKHALQVNGISAINKNIRSGGNIIGEGGALLFRKSIIEKTGFFNSDIFYVLDLDLWYKMLLHGDLYVLPHILSSFRVSAKSASVVVVNQQYADVSGFIKKTYLNKEYKIAWINYKIGTFKAFVLTMAKKVLYKYILR